MKLIGLALLCLLSALAWAEYIPEEVEDIEELEDLPDGNATDFSQPWPIASSYVGTENVVVMLTKVNWFQANEACALQGYTLAYIDTQADQTSVAADVRASGAPRTVGEPLWTSGSNIANSATWMWYATGKIFNFNYFGTKPTPSGNRCLGFHPSTSRWVADLCTEKRYFICRCQKA